jgi:hypothetical protein
MAYHKIHCDLKDVGENGYAIAESFVQLLKRERIKKRKSIQLELKRGQISLNISRCSPIQIADMILMLNVLH